MADVFHRAADWEILPERRVFKVTWDDGAVSEYEWEPMRRACPCAYCSGEGQFAGNVNASTTFSETQTTLKEVFPVGRYGLTPDGVTATTRASTRSSSCEKQPGSGREAQR